MLAFVGLATLGLDGVVRPVFCGASIRLGVVGASASAVGGSGDSLRRLAGDGAIELYGVGLGTSISSWVFGA
jgi:hypothetical protein